LDWLVLVGCNWGKLGVSGTLPCRADTQCRPRFGDIWRCRRHVELSPGARTISLIAVNGCFSPQPDPGFRWDFAYLPPNLLFGNIWISCFQIPWHSVMRLVSRHPYLVCPLNFSVCIVIVILLVSTILSYLLIQLEIIDLMNIIIWPITS